MAVVPRQVEPELLDGLAPDDPRARASRRDLRRIHRIMRTVTLLDAAIGRLALATTPRRILELGAGDGSLLLRLAGALVPPWPQVELTLLDRQDLLDAATRAAYARIGWTVRVCRQDALEWAREEDGPTYDLVVTTLFLHHLGFEELRTLFAAIAARSHAFVACEPRRGGMTAVASRLVALLGANAVTREDAVTSVAAGFDAGELGACWPVTAPGWTLDEYVARPFTHCLAAHRAP